MRKKLMVANWKMNKTVKEAEEFIFEFNKLIKQKGLKNCTDIAICAPYLQLATLRNEYKSEEGIVRVGAQNMHFEKNGAFTGEISAEMLSELAIDYCIIGHSERRQYFGETDEMIAKKMDTAVKCNIRPILCVGENIMQREEGDAFKIVGAQLESDLSKLSAEEVANIVIAYEPIWAIGTGKTASADEAEEMCAFIRNTIKSMFGESTAQTVIIQYGGSVNPQNVKELMEKENIDGGLIGGASLNADSFYDLISYAKDKE
ncbi:MAG: triose-phosphate isomerase [Eubacteriales bacterium]